MKNYLIQTIISMAYHGYLQLEGGNSMIEFIIKQASLPVENEVSLLNFGHNLVINFRFLSQM